MRAYVTGSSGFVGGWLSGHLRQLGDEVLKSDKDVDITDGPAIAAAIKRARPEVVYHLAALAHVGRSWKDPAETVRVNVTGTLNVLQAAAACDSVPRVILVSSAEVYGSTAGDQPVRESADLRPVTPYAASKVGAEFLGVQAWLGQGVPVIRVRPFNHLGPRQSADFVVSALARRVAEAEARGGGPVAVGNLQAARDFTDVRDVVRSYRMLAETGTAGEVYNVATGTSVSIAEVAHRLCDMAGVPVELREDPELVRPVDVPVFLGDASRLRAATGWEPEIAFETTLVDVLDHWRARLSS
ncbi:MAG: GDP-mannose 4,6-dehydratase [Acidimicrobiales bacterium]